MNSNLPPGACLAMKRRTLGDSKYEGESNSAFCDLIVTPMNFNDQFGHERQNWISPHAGVVFQSGLGEGLPGPLDPL